MNAVVGADITAVVGADVSAFALVSVIFPISTVVLTLIYVSVVFLLGFFVHQLAAFIIPGRCTLNDSRECQKNSTI